MNKKVYDYIKENNLINSGDKIVVGISGGADSVCLFLMLNELKNEIPIEIIPVHINHGIRGKEAKKDEHFVEKICKKYKYPCIIFNFDVAKISKKRKVSLEEAGRDVRYQAFHKVLKDYNCNKIAVAHNLNDSSETVLLSLFRGTGIKGLTGIKANRGNIIRPLLCLKRQEIEKYLKDKKVSYQTDSSNLKNEFSRNAVRNIILPKVIESINPEAVSHIQNTATYLNEIENYLSKKTDEVYHGPEIDLEKFKDLDIVIKKRVIIKAIKEVAGKLKDISSVHIEDVLKLEKNKVGKYVMLPYNIRGIKTYKSIKIEIEETKDNYEKINMEIFKQGEYILPDEKGKFLISIENNLKPFEIGENMYTKCFDYDKMKSTLFLRNRKEGDYITINSKGNTKKIKSYFVDEKIPKEEREKVLLFAIDSNVVWVVGHRVSEEFKVTEETKEIIKIEYVRG